VSSLDASLARRIIHSGFVIAQIRRIPQEMKLSSVCSLKSVPALVSSSTPPPPTPTQTIAVV
jgi:hypothetical protein